LDENNVDVDVHVDVDVEANDTALISGYSINATRETITSSLLLFLVATVRQAA